MNTLAGTLILLCSMAGKDFKIVEQMNVGAGNRISVAGEGMIRERSKVDRSPMQCKVQFVAPKRDTAQAHLPTTRDGAAPSLTPDPLPTSYEQCVRLWCEHAQWGYQFCVQGCKQQFHISP